MQTVFASWKNDKFKALYDAVQTALVKGASSGHIIKWTAGDTSAEKDQTFILSRFNLRLIDEEYLRRFKGGRRRITRTRATFS